MATQGPPRVPVYGATNKLSNPCSGHSELGLSKHYKKIASLTPELFTHDSAPLSPLSLGCLSMPCSLRGGHKSCEILHKWLNFSEL